MTESSSARLKRALHPSGREIVFDPDPHHYLLDGSPLTSVTTVIKSWFPEFDARAAAERKAAREGTSVEELLARWDRRRTEASTFGSKVHLMAELMILGRDHSAADHLAESAREKDYLEAVRRALVRIGKFYEFVDCEKIVFSPELGIAGTIDLLLRNKQTGEFVVADWKTNREIKTTSFGERTGHGPCGALHDCNFVHYSLQLGAYRHLLASEGYVAGDAALAAILIHVRTGPEGVWCDFVRPRDLRAQAAKLLATPRSISDV